MSNQIVQNFKFYQVNDELTGLVHELIILAQMSLPEG